MAILGDPDLPDYEITVLPGENAVLLTGGLKWNVAGELAAVLDQNPAVQRIYLDSPGGRLGQGIALFDLMRDRRLSTYVMTYCASACTLAFAGGEERVLGGFGVLGFHTATIPSGFATSDNAVMSEIYFRAGVSNSFILRVAATLPEDLWIPTPTELQFAGMITQLDADLKPDEVPIETFLLLLADAEAEGLPVDLGNNVWLLDLVAQGSRLTYYYGIHDEARAMVNDPGFGLAENMCLAALLATEGATVVYVWQDFDGGILKTIELSNEVCSDRL